MSTDYRITIRTDEEIAERFRLLAEKEQLHLGEMLNALMGAWRAKAVQQELCAKLLALKYSN